jgi:uncharacterized protein (DUF697 family)
MDRKAQAEKIISKWTHAAALAAGSLAAVSSVGVDTAFLTKIVVGMLRDINLLFDERKGEKQNYSKAVSALADIMFGAIMSNKILGWLPIIGNAVNAGVTAVSTKKVGWAAYIALEDGKDIDELSSKEWAGYLKRADKEYT